MSTIHSPLLLPGEQPLASACNGELLLTNYRVRQVHQAIARVEMVSITLDSVASCRLTQRSYPILLVLCVVFVCSAAVAAVVPDATSNAPQVVLFVAAAAFFGSYFVVRRNVIEITSDGGQIVAPVPGAAAELMALIQQLEQAKLSRQWESLLSAPVVGPTRT